ncbi:putative calcium-binding protein cml10 [Fagus crenata]|jgi:Ca2+-binding EF-hand superfamily protein|uniref:EF-hand domain-containing protein n=1 Tax=Fagus sylvatica TaxID=28930 RepID=A0A2N9FNR6_FAGSY
MGRGAVGNQITYKHPKQPLTEDQLRKIFKQYDVNNDGLLSKEELKKAFKGLGSCIPGIRANRGVHHADANGDGYINEDELNDLTKYAGRLGFILK